MKPEYYVHAEYSVSGGYTTYEEALLKVREEAKKCPGTKCIISRSISQHVSIANQLVMNESIIKRSQ